MSDRLYFAPNTISVVVAIALEVAGRDYELVRVPIGPDGADSPNPFRLVPVLETPAGSVREVVAILNYLADEVPAAGLLPRAGLARAEANQWLTFCASSVHPVMKLIFRAYRYAGQDEAAQANLKAHVVPVLERTFATVEAQLEGRPFLLGDTWSMADAYFGEFSAWGLNRIGLKGASGPNVARHREAYLAHPATIAAKAREKAATEAQPNPTPA
ncbi:glutathione S-transferase family protein [Zavarzinia sp. CC-PAN008]|uniref:glutathione S-transferase family protein n=1 Tax=Zavarzinia sp. CC-PAN008 TaxID=3243332 RepID=UPI003F746370